MKKTLLVALIVVGIISLSGLAARAQSVNYLGKFFADVYSAFFENPQTQKVDAQTTGNGTVTIHAQICQTLSNFANTGDVTCSVTPRDPSADEASQFSYNIQSATTTTVVLSGLGVDKPYSLPAGNYLVVFKGAPTNYLYVRKGGVFDFPYTFTVTSGQNTQVDIPYTIYTTVEKTAPVGTTISADIVDGNGNFVRALTTSETQSASFDIQHSVPATGGSVGSHSGNFDTQVASGKLNTSYSLPTYVHSGSILTNIKSPSGFVVRSIEAGPSGTYFDPGIGNVTIHFTQSPASSQVQSVDQMLYVPNGISYVKKIAQAYSDSEYKYSNLDVDLFNYRGNNNRPFPTNWTVAKYSGVPYLFMNGTGKIIVYNISDPANPKQVSEYIISALEKFNVSTRHTGAGDITSGQCDPEHAGTHAFITSAKDIFAVDNSPYLLINIEADYGMAGTAVLSLDPSTMAMTGYPQWTRCQFNSNGVWGTAYGMYKGSDGQTYFVSQPFDDSNYTGFGVGTVNIFSLNSAGAVNRAANLVSPASYGQVSGSAANISYRTGVYLFNLGDKTYLIGSGASTVSNPNNLPVYIYDISNPKNISKINENIVGYGKKIVDNQGKRLYVQSIIPNPAATSTSYTIPKTLPIFQVYDLSVLPSAPKLIATYNKPTDLLNPTQVSADFAQIAKRLNITPSTNLIDINNSSFSYGSYGISSVQLINISNNLAYVSLYTSGKTPWDTIANQAGVTDESEYGTNAIQFIVDLTNTTQPKILGMIFGHTEYTPYAISAGGWFDVPLYGSIFDYNGYIYRANFRIADVWKLGNPPAQTVGGGGAMTGSGVGAGAVTIPSGAPAFSFQSLLNIFRRILNNQ